MKTCRIAVIPGDGIGKEVMPEGLRVLETVASKFDIGFAFDHFDFASCDYHDKHGRMMPANWKDQIGGHDAIFFGAVGAPLWTSIAKIGLNLRSFCRTYRPMIRIWVKKTFISKNRAPVNSPLRSV